MLSSKIATYSICLTGIVKQERFAPFLFLKSTFTIFRLLMTLFVPVNLLTALNDLSLP